MPMTPMDDLNGELCDSCEENFATHIYGNAFLCCECHGGNIISQEEMEEYYYADKKSGALKGPQHG